MGETETLRIKCLILLATPYRISRDPHDIPFEGTGPERIGDFPEVTGQIGQKQESEPKCVIQGSEGLLPQSGNPLRTFTALPFQDLGSGKTFSGYSWVLTEGVLGGTQSYGHSLGAPDGPQPLDVHQPFSKPQSFP